jgi:cytochrome c nitrite reductase small subunit
VRITTAVVLIGVLIGVAAGLGSYTFIYAKGYSYLTNNPAACANCHVMGQYYAGWMKGPHRSVAVCNDCHTPAGEIPKYMTKASNGFWHSFYFTTGRFPDVLPIKAHNLEIVENACRKCHSEITAAIEAHPAHQRAGKISCLRCHSDVGHM